MFKLPFTKEGHIKIVSFLKIALVIALFVVGISILFNQTMALFRLSSTVIYITTILFVIQLCISGYQILIDIYNTIKTFVVKIAFHYHEKLRINLEEHQYTYKEVAIPSHKTYLRYSVIRC